MRIAKCVSSLKIEIVGTLKDGTQKRVAVSEGWQGDLDEVIGVRQHAAKKDAEGKELEPARDEPTTIADALGHHLTFAGADCLNPNFELPAQPRRPRPATTDTPSN